MSGACRQLLGEAPVEESMPAEESARRMPRASSAVAKL